MQLLKKSSQTGVIFQNRRFRSAVFFVPNLINCMRDYHAGGVIIFLKIHLCYIKTGNILIISTNENGICFAIVIKTPFFGLRGVFWGKTGSEAIIPVDRLIPPPVGGKFRSQSFFCVTFIPLTL